MNDLPNMHDEINESLARRLQHEVQGLRGVFGHIGAPPQTAARSNAGSTDAPGLADA